MAHLKNIEKFYEIKFDIDNIDIITVVDYLGVMFICRGKFEISIERVFISF